jgi:hypothetical protein
MKNTRWLSFLLVAFCLLVSAVFVCPSDEAVQITGQTKRLVQPLGITVESVDFQYRPDEAARLLALKQKWIKSKGRRPNLIELGDLAMQAYTMSTLDEPLPIWRAQGGPSPWVFRPRVYLVNGTDEAVLNQTVKLEVRAKMGELRVDPDALLTDYGFLEQSAQWQTLYQEDLQVPVVAPGEDKPVDAKLIVLSNLLGTSQSQWPVLIEATATIGTEQKSVSLRLVPNHFVLPDMSY